MDSHSKGKSITFFMLIFVLIAASFASASSRRELETTQRELGNFQSLRINSKSVSIETFRSAGSARLEATLDSRRKLTVSERGNDVIIEVSQVRRVSLRGGRENIVLYIPNGKDVVLQAGSGSIKVEGLMFSELEVDVGSGSVDIDQCSGPTTIDVGSGSIRLNDVEGSFDVSTGSGSTKGEGIKLTNDSSFRAGSGSIELSILNTEDELAFDLDAGSGSIRVNDIRGADRVVVGSGNIEVTGRTGSGSQRYETR